MLAVLWLVLTVLLITILVIVTTALLLLLVVLILPIRYQGRAVVAEPLSFSGSVRMWWLVRFEACYEDGILQRQLTVLGYTKTFSWTPTPKVKETGNGEPPGRDEAKRQTKAKKQGKNAGETWTLPKITATLRMAKDVLRIIQPDHLTIKGRLGLAEPHLTSYILLVLLPLGQIKGACVAVEPVWHKEVCDVTIQMGGELVLWVVAVRLLRYALSRPMRSHWMRRFLPLGQQFQSKKARSSSNP